MAKTKIKKNSEFWISHEKRLKEQIAKLQKERQEAHRMAVELEAAEAAERRTEFAEAFEKALRDAGAAVELSAEAARDAAAAYIAAMPPEALAGAGEGTDDAGSADEAQG